MVFASNATLTNSGVITGGRGGNGGNGGAGANGYPGIYFAYGANGGNGGNGGAGGAAVVITNGGALTNSGTISGGAGGSGGSGGAPGTYVHVDGNTMSAGNPGGVGSAGSAGLGVIINGGTTTLTNQAGGIINNGVVYRRTGNLLHDGSLTNDGRINGGVTYQQYGHVNLTNNGRIDGGVTYQQVYGDGILTNNGLIMGGIAKTSYTRLNLVNNGFIGGDVVLQYGANTVTLVTTTTVSRGISGNLFIEANTYDPMLILAGSGTQHYSGAVWGTTTLQFGSPTQEVVKEDSGTWIIDIALNNNGFSAGSGTSGSAKAPCRSVPGLPPTGVRSASGISSTMRHWLLPTRAPRRRARIFPARSVARAG